MYYTLVFRSQLISMRALPKSGYARKKKPLREYGHAGKIMEQ
jgi:hypothetical protein